MPEEAEVKVEQRQYLEQAPAADELRDVLLADGTAVLGRTDQDIRNAMSALHRAAGPRREYRT